MVVYKPFNIYAASKSASATGVSRTLAMDAAGDAVVRYPIFADRATAQSATVGANMSYLRTDAYSVSAGQSKGGALYRVAVDDAEYTSFPTRLKITTADSKKFVIAEVWPNAFQAGAVGDNTTDDIAALQALADLGGGFYLPDRTFKITSPLYLDGDYISMTSAAAAKLNQTTANMPGIVVSGSRQNLQFPVIETPTRAATTDYASVGILFTARGSGSNGVYWSTIDRINVSNFAIGVHTNAAISDTLASNAAAGATSVTATNAQTRADGTYPWMPGMFATITLNSGTQIVRITGVSGATLTLEDALTGAATSGNAITVKAGNFFSNEIPFVKVYNASFSHFFHNGGSTQINIGTMHLHNPDHLNDGGDITDLQTTAIPLYIRGVNEVTIAALNLEWIKFTAGGIVANGGDVVNIQHLHTEGMRFGADTIGVIGGSQSVFKIGSWTCDDLYSFDAEVTTVAALVKPQHTVLRATKSRVSVETFVMRNTIAQTASRLYWTYDANALGNVIVDFGKVVLHNDAAIRTEAQMGSVSTNPILGKIGGIIPDRAIGFVKNVRLNATGDSLVPMGKYKKYRVTSILVCNAGLSLSTALVGAFDEASGAGTRLTTAANLALSGITGTGKAVALGLETAEATTVRDGLTYPNLYFRVDTLQAAPSAVSVGASGTRSFTGIGSFSGRYLRTIGFTTPHSFTVGQAVTVASCGSADYNGTALITSVTSTTITYYKYGSGSVESGVADTATTVQLIPTVDVIVYGEEF